jgi:protein-tyrosine phosphatase
MIDLHTHILWDWDDGPDDRAQSLQMARIAQKDGIRAIAATPHLFRLTRHGNDLKLLRERMLEFKHEVNRLDIEVHWGAEVYVHPEIVRTVEKYRFTIDQTSYVFIEFPAELVPAGAENMIAGLMNKGFVPIISHPERNAGFQEQPYLLYHLVEAGCAAQVTAGSITGEFGREVRNTARLFLEHNLVHFIASDAHGVLSRRPVLSEAVEAAAKIVGEDKARAMVDEVPRAVLMNQALPDYGEPRNPTHRKTWTRRLFGRTGFDSGSD